MQMGSLPQIQNLLNFRGKSSKLYKPVKSETEQQEKNFSLRPLIDGFFEVPLHKI